MNVFKTLRRLWEFRGGIIASRFDRAPRERRRPDYPVWAVLADRVRRSGARSVLEVGCGSGHFARMLRDLGVPQYLGLDTNGVKFPAARAACPGYRFEIADVFKTRHMRGEDYDVAVMSGFLETVRWDLVALELVRPQRRVVGIVTAGGPYSRSRQFTSAQQVHDRYSAVLRDLHVEPIHLAHGRMAFLFDGVK